MKSGVGGVIGGVKNFVFISIIFAIIFASNYGLVNEKIKTKRSLYQLARAVQCTKSNKTTLDLLKTLNCYGCWCGLGGVGEPVDELDSCCQHHDHCYDDLKDRQICNRLIGEVYWRNYDMICAPDEENAFSAIVATTTGHPGASHFDHSQHPRCRTASTTACGQGLCICDVQFASCVEKWNVTTRKTCPYERPCIALS